MERPIYAVSTFTLKKNIYNIKRIDRKNERNFSLSRWTERGRLEHHANRVLDSFNEGYLKLQKDQYKIFAQYIDTFGGYQKKDCLKKLQELADFDVQQYIEDSQKSLWDKLFDFGFNKVKAKSQKRMKKEMKKYVEACRTGECYKAKEIRDNAEAYVEAFLNDGFAMPRADENMFKCYIKTILYPVIAGYSADKALNKIRTHDYRAIGIEVKKEGLWEDVKKNSEKVLSAVKGFFSNVAHSIRTVKLPHVTMKLPHVTMKLPHVTMKLPHVTMKLPRVKMPKVNMSFSRQTKQNLSRFGKVAGLTVLVAGGVSFGVSKCSGGGDKKNVQMVQNNPNKGEGKINNDTTVFRFQPVSTFSVANVFENNQQVVDTPQQNKEDNDILSAKQLKRQAVVNHHEHILSKRLGEKKKKQLYATIENQIDKGIFSLPDSIGKEEFAYALTMYRAYGVESSLQKACLSEEKLSNDENNQIIQDIVTGGDTGLGVKKKAEERRLKTNKGPLERGNGLYNHMSKKDQKKHNMNLHQLRLAKQKLKMAR